MVLNSGLSSCDRKAFNAALGKSHQMRRRIRILDIDHNPIADVSDAFLEGQVNVDSDGEVSRTATCSLFDPRRSIGFDTGNPSKGIVSPKYLLALSRGIYVDELARWIDVRVGTLWLNKPTRSGDVLMLEAQGKEAIARKPTSKQIKFSKSTLKTTVVRRILESIGETRFRIEPSSQTLSGDFVLAMDSSPWDACKRIANSMDRQLFYDAEGYVVLRVRPITPLFTFRYGNGGTILADPQFTYDDGEIFNEVRATGGTPKGKNAPIVKKARVDPSSPLYIKRHGEFVPFRYDVTNDKLTTPEQVQQLADDTLARVVLDSQSATWDSMPVWHLEQGDPVRLTDAIDDHGNGAKFSQTVALRQMSIPLTSGSQSNGYMRRVSRSKSKIRKAA